MDAGLLQLLQSGGPELLDDLSLAKQCKIGENIVTGGYALPTKCKAVKSFMWGYNN